MPTSRCTAACSSRRALKMATYKKRNGRWHVRVRRNGYDPECASFGTKDEAEAWAKGVESQMSRRQHIVDKRSHVLTVGQVIAEYIAIVIDAHRPHCGRACAIGSASVRERVGQYRAHSVED